MKCPYCNFENPEKSRFCGKCGKVFPKKEISYSTIFIALIIIGVLAIIMFGLPNPDRNVDNEKIQTPGITKIPVLTTITISPSSASMVAGDIQLFNAVTLDQFNEPITASIKWSSSNSAAGTIDSSGRFTAIAAGPTTITASGGTVSGSATITVTSSPITPTGFRIVELILRADPSNYAGPCPVKITFSGRISVAGGNGIVSYKFIRGDGASAPIQTLLFSSAGSQDVSTTWTIGGPGKNYSNWEAIKAFDPYEVESPHANFIIRCNP